MAKNKKEKKVTTPEDLRNNIKGYNRKEVLEIIKSKDFSIEELDDATEIYQQLVTLRDMSIIDSLAAQMKQFEVSMFDIDLTNARNCVFINEVLTKHTKKFALDDANVSKEVFALACRVGNTKIPALLMKKNATYEQYIQLASSSYSTFQTILNIKPASLDGETTVQIMYHAALCDNGQSRMQDFISAGFDINTINDEDETIMDLLKKHIENDTYPSGKKGIQQKQADKATLQYLSHEASRDKKAEHTRKMKKTGLIVLGTVLIVAVIVGFSFWYTNKNKKDATSTDTTSSTTSSTDDTSSDTSSDDASADSSSDTSNTTSSTLNTDASLVVADGDTVNIDYTGYIDGEAFDGGSTNGSGTDLTIGSGTYIDGFEDQLIGCNVGDTVDVNVTFPEDYGVDSLNGKDATFTVTVNGIYQ